MPNKDYDNFVARMGSFDDNFDDIFEGIDLNSHIKGVSHMDDNQRALSHFGVPGMKWGVRRAAKQTDRAVKLSKKYGIKVGEGVKEKEVKNSLKSSELYKNQLRDKVQIEYANKTAPYFMDAQKYGLKPMSEKEYNQITDKTNRFLAQIDKIKVSEIKVNKENGKRYIESVLNTKDK